MAKRRKTKPQRIGGPFLTMAVLCERVLTDKDEVVSLIRIVNKFTIRGPWPSMPPGAVESTMAIGFRRGDAPAKHYVRIACYDPGGKHLTEVTKDFKFPKPEPDAGQNLFVNLRLAVEKTGRYWFHVMLDGKLVTKMSMQVVYQQTQAQ
ncbi:MAG: hypothetical protein HYS13_07820 [Planctomycetia bacterium]|nr:hypothetical protein [Planctomycetia bacterium]